VWVAILAPMTDVRRATVADAAELVRLRGVMLASITGHEPPDNGWRQAAYDLLEARLSAQEPTLIAIVVDHPDRPGALAACAVGSIEHRLTNPHNLTGAAGYIFNVATDLDQRRRGYSRLCVTALLDWYRNHGITTVDLRASPDGEPLYRSLGFVRTPDPAMRLHLPSPNT